MKSEGATAQLEGMIEDLLKSAASIETLDDLADRFEAAGADKILVAELRKTADDLAKAKGDTAEETAEGNAKEDEPSDAKKKPKKRGMAKWLIDQLNITMEKEEIVAETKPEGTKPEGEEKKDEPLTRDALMKGLSEALTPFKETLVTEINASMDEKIKVAIEPLTKRVDTIAEAKGLKKSIDGQESQTKEPATKLPMRKEFGKGMFDDVIAPARVAFMQDKVNAAVNGNRAGEEE